MWGRRRSEPGIGSRESLSLASTINLDEALDTPPPSLGEQPQSLDAATPTGPATPEVSAFTACLLCGDFDIMAVY